MCGYEFGWRDPVVRYLVVLGKIEVLEDVLRILEKDKDVDRVKKLLEVAIAEYSEVLKGLRIYVDPAAHIFFEIFYFAIFKTIIILHPS